MQNENKKINENKIWEEEKQHRQKTQGLRMIIKRVAGNWKTGENNVWKAKAALKE